MAELRSTSPAKERHAITTVVDNWKYDTLSGSWMRLADLPIASGNFGGNTVYLDRYVILVGGYQYSNVTLVNGSNVAA